MNDLFTRIKNSISSDINDLLDQKEQKNPIAMLNQHLRTCEKEANRVRELINRQYLLKDNLIREYHEADELAKKRKSQAVIADRAGETELYAFIIREQEDYAQKANRLKNLYEQTIKQLEHLEQNYAEMKRKLKDMYVKRMELMSRENIANAEYRINQIVHPESQFGQSCHRFADSEHYIDQLEKKINAAYTHQSLDSRIEQLKRKLNQNQPDAE